MTPAAAPAVSSASAIDAAEAPTLTDLAVETRINADLDEAIGAHMLAERLRAGDPLPWPDHVAAFFCDCPTRTAFEFCSQHLIAKEPLAAAYLATRSHTGRADAAFEAALHRLLPGFDL